MTDRPILFSAPMVRALLEGRKTQTRRIVKVPGIMGGRFPVLPPEEIIELEPGEFRRGIFHYASTDALSGPYDLRFAVRDRLWVRETWRPHYLGDGVWDLDISYAADGSRHMILDGDFGEGDWLWPKGADRGNVPSIHMPRWASRLTLTVTDVRVQRLQDITEDDAIAEGVVIQHPTEEDIEWAKIGDEETGRAYELGPVWVVPGTDCGFGQKPRQPIWGPTPTSAFQFLWDSINGPTSWDDNPWVAAISFDVQRGNIDAETAP